MGSSGFLVDTKCFIKVKTKHVICKIILQDQTKFNKKEATVVEWLMLVASRQCNLCHGPVEQFLTSVITFDLLVCSGFYFLTLNFT